MKNVFFIGINGIGMSGLAKIMSHNGYNVFGSDIKRKPITNVLESRGIKIYIGHNEENLKGMDLVVYSSAIKSDNIEYRYARDNQITMYKRGELLGKLMDKRYTGIAVAGTHGKTTTSSMMSVVMETLDPTIVVGGIIPEINSNSKVGESKYFVAEADESDNSFLYLYPEFSIITNIEPEHLENYEGNYELLKDSFSHFIRQTNSKSLVNKDNKELYEIAKNSKNTFFYSLIDKDVDIYADNIRSDSSFCYFDVYKEGIFLGKFCLAVPGKHNIYNALGVIYIADELGISLMEIQEKLKLFKGAKRRFDIIHNNSIKIIDDYAHHPTEVKTTIEAAKTRNPKRLITIFQPHRYSRINNLLKAFDNVFDLADRVIFLPIYSAGEKQTFGLNSEKFAKRIKSKNRIENILSESQLFELIKNDYRSGDMYLFMGAGDVSLMANNISEEMDKIDNVVN